VRSGRELGNEVRCKGRRPLRVSAGLAALLVLIFSAHAGDTAAISGRAMGTTWSVKFSQPARPLTREVVEREVADRLEQLEQIFSTYRPQSALSRFNAATQAEWIPVTAEMAEVASASRQISELTGGAYDVTVHPLVQLWGFAAKSRSNVLPTATEIATVRARVDWRKLEVRLSPPALRKTSPQLSVDFSSIAKGFSADALSELLVQLGAPNHLVQIGGDIKTRGAPPGVTGWATAIERPDVASPEIATVVTLNGQALSTSGDYRNFFQVGRRRYGHIIDPRSGEPVSNSLVAVSVLHASCARSSALATALFVLGSDDGFRLAVKEGWACLFFVRGESGVVPRATPAFDRFVQRKP
jgi:FAD:protein FMN transferase